MSLFKDGWHPTGDKEIHRATWKKDIKNMVSRKDEGAIRARDHVSAPLSTLKDPESFGPPPKHSAYYPDAQPKKTTKKKPAIASAAQQEDDEDARPAPAPFRVNTTGLDTSNLPQPPARQDAVSTLASPSVARPIPQLPVPSALTTGRPVPALPPRAITGARTGPPPVLPPRQTENPSEYDPPAPPAYGEAIRTPAVDSAIGRLGRSGVSVPGFGIGSASQQPVQEGQMNELQQRFARMNANKDNIAEGQNAMPMPTWKQAQTAYTAVNAASNATGIDARTALAQSNTQNNTQLPTWKQAQTAYTAANAASKATGISAESALSMATQQKKKPPPLPPKRTELNESDGNAPPPIPMSSKPRPG